MVRISIGVFLRSGIGEAEIALLKISIGGSTVGRTQW